MTLANPVAAAVIGLSLLGERLRGGAGGVLLALTGAALAAWGVLQLSRAAPDRPETAAPGLAGPGLAGTETEPTGPAPAGPGVVPRQPGPGHLTRL